MRRTAGLLVLLLVASACDQVERGPAETATTATTTTQGVRGESAPDFQLQLSDGSGFVLSEERRPVYLLFWAEW